MISTIFQLLLLYVVFVFTGGTLIQTGHPVAVEVGELIHMITFVEPGIGWAETNDHDMIAGGLRTLADGMDIGGLLS